MTKKEIREEYKTLPHIKKVWVLDGNIHIHQVAGATELSLDGDDIVPDEKETKSQETAKPKKKK